MNDKKIAIRVKNLGKKYILGGPQQPYHTLRDTIVNSLKAPLKSFHRALPFEGFWALKDVSFELEQGEVLGIIGRNGAGKSALLKILSRITTPTEGTIELHGRVGSLLEVGTGFHPEMTGRENIFLNGSILGMKKIDIEQKFDDIIKFSETEKFLDTPVKRYSSGMYVRLAFSVAAHLETEILVVDEVLAVGDIGFQKKCLGKMKNIAGEGRTVLFVSHNMTAIMNLCKMGMLLEKGHIIEFNTAEEVVGHYIHGSEGSIEGRKSWETIKDAPGDDYVRLHAVKVTQNGEDFLQSVDISQNIDIEVYYWNLVDQAKYYLGLILRDNYGNIVFTSLNLKSCIQEEDLLCGAPLRKGFYKTTCRIPSNLLNTGNFSVSISIIRYPGFGEYPHHTHIHEDAIISFEGIDMGNMLESHSMATRFPGVIRPKLEWSSNYLRPLSYSDN